MTGNEPRYEPTVEEIFKGNFPTSWHFELSWRLMTSVLCVAELLGAPVETNIVDTAKKKEARIKLKTVHD